MTVGPRLHKGRPSPGWWHSFIFLFLPLSDRVISFCDLRNTGSTMEYHPNAITIPLLYSMMKKHQVSSKVTHDLRGLLGLITVTEDGKTRWMMQLMV